MVNSESAQNCRVPDDGSDLWRSFDPNPLLEQGHLKLIAQDYPDGFWISAMMKLQNISGQPVLVLVELGEDDNSVIKNFWMAPLTMIQPC